jgi:hypothetical protein
MAGGKTDMERVGLFKEMTYHTIGDKYKRPGDSKFSYMYSISARV